MLEVVRASGVEGASCNPSRLGSHGGDGQHAVAGYYVASGPSERADWVMICENCGATNAIGSRFCSNCGSPLSGASLPAQPTGPIIPGSAASATLQRGSELRWASVLFVDLVGYTSLTHSWDAVDVRDMLSGYFDLARRIIDRYGGEVAKFIGDAVVAVWGSR